MERRRRFGAGQWVSKGHDKTIVLRKSNIKNSEHPESAAFIGQVDDFHKGEPDCVAGGNEGRKVQLVGRE